MRIWGSASSEKRRAWVRLERAYAAMEHAEGEFAVALQAVVRDGATATPATGSAPRTAIVGNRQIVGGARA